MSLTKRIERLERVSRGGSCSTCGFGPAIAPGDRPVRVEYRNHGVPAAPPPAP